MGCPAHAAVNLRLQLNSPPQRWLSKLCIHRQGPPLSWQVALHQEATIHVADPIKVQRAVEVDLEAGTPHSHRQHADATCLHRCLIS